MKKEQLEAFAREATKSIKIESDLNDFRQMFTKVTIETALNAELDDQLGYDKHEKSTSDNSRNGVSSKTLCTEDSQFELGPVNTNQLVSDQCKVNKKPEDNIQFIKA